MCLSRRTSEPFSRLPRYIQSNTDFAHQNVQSIDNAKPSVLAPAGSGVPDICCATRKDLTVPTRYTFIIPSVDRIQLACISLSRDQGASISLNPKTNKTNSSSMAPSTFHRWADLPVELKLHVLSYRFVFRNPITSSNQSSLCRARLEPLIKARNRELVCSFPKRRHSHVLSYEKYVSLLPVSSSILCLLCIILGKAGSRVLCHKQHPDNPTRIRPLRSSSRQSTPNPLHTSLLPASYTVQLRPYAGDQPSIHRSPRAIASHVSSHGSPNLSPVLVLHLAAPVIWGEH